MFVGYQWGDGDPVLWHHLHPAIPGHDQVLEGQAHHPEERGYHQPVLGKVWVLYLLSFSSVQLCHFFRQSVS